MEVSAFETSPEREGKEKQILGFGSLSIYDKVKSYYPVIDGDISDAEDSDKDLEGLLKDDEDYIKKEAENKPD